jgi:uncharacterized protein (TIGR03083 family)
MEPPSLSTRDADHLDDVRLAAAASREVLQALVDADWRVPAGTLEWDCRTTLEHVIYAVDRYSLYLAGRLRERLPYNPVRYPECSNRELLTIMEARAAVLAHVARAASPEARGYHVWGWPDRTGYVAMGCVEIVVHTDDIARGLGAEFQPPEAVCRRALARLFPWAPTTVDGWAALQWATGRIALPDREQVPPNWAWHASPLEDWDGTIKTHGG